MSTRARKPQGLGAEEALALANKAADQSVEALALTREEVAKIPKPAPPDPRDDPNEQRLLQRASTYARRLNPLRARWPELREFEARLNELHLRHHEVHQALTELNGRRQHAPQQDEVRLADWIAGGRKGTRPAPEAARLDEQLEETEADLAALEQLMDRTSTERAELSPGTDADS